LEDERQVLSKDIKGCEDYITHQVDEMKKLASTVGFKKKREVSEKVLSDFIKFL
jgi:hypothetical protein